MRSTTSRTEGLLRPRQRLIATLGLVTLGLVAQAGLVVLAFPTQVTVPPSPPSALSCYPNCMTITLASPLNVSFLPRIGTTVTQSYAIAPQSVISGTRVVEQLGSGWFYRAVEPANLFDLTSNTITATLPAASPQSPFVFTKTIGVLEPGLRTQLLRVERKDQLPLVISNTVQAMIEPPFRFSYTYPVVQPIDSGRIIWGWQTVQNAQFPHITETHVTGTFEGAVIRSVAPQGLCRSVISSFDCVFKLMSPNLARAFTVTTEAIEPGLMKLAFQASGGGTILSSTLTSNVQPPVAISIPIDIKPGAPRNNVNPTSHGSIPVALFSMEGFEVFDHLDQLSLLFGRTGTEDSLLFCNPRKANRNRRFDLICHFDTQLAGFQEGDTEGILTGRTFAGAPIRAVDSVRIVPAR